MNLPGSCTAMKRLFERGTAAVPGDAPPTAVGRVIDIGSVGGKVATPFMAGNNPGKLAVEGFSQALYRDRMPFGIGVVIAGPGAVHAAIGSKLPAQRAAVDVGGVHCEPLRLFRNPSSRMRTSGDTGRGDGQRIVATLDATRTTIRVAWGRARWVNSVLAGRLPRHGLDIRRGKAKLLPAPVPPP